MMLSFNFLTQVPIEEFLSQEQHKASRLTARIKSRASLKIEEELQRRIKEKELDHRIRKASALKPTWIN